jgi:hypothetical protein
MLDSQCAQKLKAWIEGLTDSLVILRSDAPEYDWPRVESLFLFFGCWPNNLRRTCGAISFDNANQQQRFDNALREYWKINQARRYHALVDARSLQFAWRSAIKRGF